MGHLFTWQCAEMDCLEQYDSDCRSQRDSKEAAKFRRGSTKSIFVHLGGEQSSPALLSAREGIAAVRWQQLRSSRVKLAFMLRTIVTASSDSPNTRELSCSTKISTSFVFKSSDNICLR